jgi:hypothetical protein
VDQASFAAALDRASQRCREFAAEFVTDHLPAALRFDLRDGRLSGPPVEQCVQHGWRMLPPLDFQGASAAQVAAALWADGWVPAWVNLSVYAVDAEFTRVETTVSRQLVDPAIFRQPLWGPNAPFEVRGPSLPPDWVSVAESGPFRLGWLAALRGQDAEPGAAADTGRL